jgi:hypothetical protein
VITFGGLGFDPEVGRGGRAEVADREAAGHLAHHGGQGGGSTERLKYVRAPAAETSFTPFEPRVRALLTEHPDMPATVLAERVGWSGSPSWFRENVARLRPEQRRADPADRLVWSP